MNPKHLPMIDTRYWFAILAASMSGANTAILRHASWGWATRAGCFRGRL
jgi:hypothetical protein